jgi:hypothetical protein
MSSTLRRYRPIRPLAAVGVRPTDRRRTTHVPDVGGQLNQQPSRAGRLTAVGPTSTPSRTPPGIGAHRHVTAKPASDAAAAYPGLGRTGAEVFG